MTFYYFALSYVNDLSSRRRRASPRSSRWRRCSWTRSSAAQYQPYQFLTNNSTSTVQRKFKLIASFSRQLLIPGRFSGCGFFSYFFLLYIKKYIYLIKLSRKNIRKVVISNFRIKWWTRSQTLTFHKQIIDVWVFVWGIFWYSPP